MKLLADYYYNKQLIKGYTHIDNNLIIYNKPDSISETCNFFDENMLTIFNDTIVGYNEIELIDMKYEPVTRVWKIISQDSLVTIYTGSDFSDEIEKVLK